MATPFFGMRGTGDWPEDARPESWREMISYLYPNGDATLTAMLGMLDSEEVDDPIFHWWEQGLPSQSGAIAGVFTDAALTTPYVSGGVEGDVLFVKVAQDLVKEFKDGHSVLFEKDGDPRYETQGSVIGTLPAGANSYIAVKLDENADATYDLDEVDLISVIGSAYAQGSHMPDPIAYDPTPMENYTQIFRNSLSLTRTMRKTRLRYGSSAYQLHKLGTLELHAIEMEKALIWGKRYRTIGHNNQELYKTGGIMWSLRTYAPENIFDYRFDPDYAGLTWEEGGEDWLRAKLLGVYNFGSNEKLGVMGSGAGLGLETLIRAGSEFNITPTTKSYGFRVGEWTLSNGTLMLKSHPLFNTRANYSNAMIILEPQRLGFRYIDDTFFVEDPPKQRNRNHSKDSTDEEYITEGGFKLPWPKTGAALFGIGQDNNLTP